MLFSEFYHEGKSSIMVQRLPQGKARNIWPGGYQAHYLSSGHLVFMQKGILYGAAFDLDALTLKGRPMTLVEGVMHGEGGGQFDVSQEGSLVYSLDGDTFIPGRPVPWEGAIYDGKYGGIDLHPDGKKLLVRSLADGEVESICDRVVLFENFVDYLREQIPGE